MEIIVDSFIYSINATVPVFLVMVLGGLIKKIGIIDEHFANVANRYVFKVALPVLLFRDLSKSDFKSQFEPKFVLYCSIVTILMFSLVWIFTEILMKDDTQKGAFIQGSCRSSAAILGMAFVQNMYSDTGMAPLMIVAAVPLFNIFAVVVLTFKAHPKEVVVNEIDTYETVQNINDNEEVVTDNITIKKTVSHKTDNIKKASINIVKNPIIIGIVLGFISSMLNMKYPVIINKTIESIAQTATPIALICIGAGFEGRKAIKKIKPTLVATFIKLIGLAAVFIPIGVALGFRNQELVAALIMLASPTTVTSYVMAKSMDNDEVLSSSIIVLTTVLSSITLTGWIFILRTFGLI
jgi:predicted permease